MKIFDNFIRFGEFIINLLIENSEILRYMM